MSTSTARSTELVTLSSPTPGGHRVFDDLTGGIGGTADPFGISHGDDRDPVTLGYTGVGGERLQFETIHGPALDSCAWATDACGLDSVAVEATSSYNNQTCSC